MRRERILELPRVLRGALGAPATLRLWAAVRRHPDAVLAAGLGLGVLAMILHWW